MRIGQKVRAAAVTAALWTATAFGQSISIGTDKPAGIYRVGDRVTWIVRSLGVTGPLTVAIDPNQGPAVKTETIAPPADAGDAVTVTYDFAAPGTVLLKVAVKTADGKEITAVGGAIAAPESIGLSAPRPDDFDAFWADQIRNLRAIPAGPKLTPADAGKPGVAYNKIILANINGTLVRGQIARPEKGDKFPALLQLQYAGVYALQKNWVTDRAADGWLSMNIEAHDLPIDEPEQFYKDQFAGPLKSYWAIGNDDRRTSYFLRMYLSCVRAVDYLKTRPDWDGRTLVVFGGSQGGQQTLVTAGLCDGISAAMADVPAGCDMLGPDAGPNGGRRGGWPQWYDWTRGLDWHTAVDPKKVHEASRYFDTANFASRIRCPVLVATGLTDETCPAAGVVAAFNQIPGTNKQLLLMPDAAHQSVNNSHAPYDKRLWGQWLPALLHGTTPPVGQ